MDILQTKVIPIIHHSSSGVNGQQDGIYYVIFMIGIGLLMLFIEGVSTLVDMWVNRNGKWKYHGLKKKIRSCSWWFVSVPIVYWTALILFIDCNN